MDGPEWLIIIGAVVVIALVWLLIRSAVRSGTRAGKRDDD